MEDAPLDLESLYKEYFSKVYNYIFYRLLHRENTEDLVSDIFLKIANNIDSYDPHKAGLGTWVFVIAANTLRDYYRTRKLCVSLEVGAFSGQALSVEFEEQYEQILSPKRRALFQALSTLSERERMMLCGKYFFGMHNRELARWLDMNESTVGSVLMRARKKLRLVLHPD